MISLDYDFRHWWKITVIAAATIFCIWAKSGIGLVMVMLAAYYAIEAHQYYKVAKAYKRLGGHIKRAIGN